MTEYNIRQFIRDVSKKQISDNKINTFGSNTTKSNTTKSNTGGRVSSNIHRNRHNEKSDNKFLIPQKKIWQVPRVTSLNLLPLTLKTDDEKIDKDYNITKLELETSKSKLDEIKNLDVLLAIMDHYAPLKYYIKKNYNLHPVTNATLKIIELSLWLNLLNDTNRVFCNAEFPGAFIMGLHYLCKIRHLPFQFIASSYFPDSSNTALDDKYKLYENYRGNWLMGPKPNALPEDEKDIDGDITKSENIVILSEGVLQKWSPDLYTSDAGVESDFNKQEESTALINFGQILCGLLTLTIGGKLIVKQFTFFSRFSRSLIGLLSYFFDDLYIVKPVTSRSRNSEIYLVGIGFRGISDIVSNQLLERMEEYKDKLPCDYDYIIDISEIDLSLFRISKAICAQQISFLDEIYNLSIKYKHNYETLRKIMFGKVKPLMDDWLNTYNLEIIQDAQKLFHKTSN